MLDDTVDDQVRDRVFSECYGMDRVLKNNSKVLMEAAIVERLRRSSRVELHPELLNAPLIYDETGRKALTRIYQEYVDIANQSALPILLCTPTWRANRDRVNRSDFPSSINIDAATFLREFRGCQIDNTIDIGVGGLIGCKNDCYKPDQGLSTSEAYDFHSWQIDQLAIGRVDYLIAQTLPNVAEALGIARAMESTGLQAIISFVISRDGLILDGTKLLDAIEMIDDQTVLQPLGYMVNCAYPAFLCPQRQPAELYKRLIGYQANASSLDHCDLDGSKQLETEQVSAWGDLMIELNEHYGVKVLGGCCGTNGDHLRYIAER